MTDIESQENEAVAGVTGIYMSGSSAVVAEAAYRPRFWSGRNWPLIIGGTLTLMIVVLAVFHSLIEPYPPGANVLRDRLQAPSSHHLLGTDEVGRDELSRVIAGFPNSLGVAGIAVLIAVSIGTILGVIGSAWAGWRRYLVRRSVDFGIAFPFLVIAIVVIVVVGHGFWALSITLGVVTWPIFARVTLAEGLVIAEQEYLLAARLMGVSRLGQIHRHIVPALRQTLLVMTAFMFADLILLQAALSFLGLGAPSGTPDWGNELLNSEPYLSTAPWLLAAPSGAIVLTVIAANLLGDGLARRATSASGGSLRRMRRQMYARRHAGAAVRN